MRVVVAALFVLDARAADHPTRVSDFCGMPSSSCGRHFVDDQGHDHVMSCDGGK